MGESSKVACEFPTSVLIYQEPCEPWLRDEHRPVYPLPFDSLEANRSKEVIKIRVETNEINAEK